jgi:hypothetical protein
MLYKWMWATPSFYPRTYDERKEYARTHARAHTHTHTHIYIYIYYGCATRSRQKWIGGLGGLYTTLTLTQKYQSTYLHNRETKLDINASTSSVSVPPLSASLSLLALSITSYM